MLTLRDFYHLPALDPLIGQMTAERSGLLVIAGLDPRPDAGTDGAAFLPSGRHGLFGIVLDQLPLQIGASAADGHFANRTDGGAADALDAAAHALGGAADQQRERETCGDDERQQRATALLGRAPRALGQHRELVFLEMMTLGSFHSSQLTVNS